MKINILSKSILLVAAALFTLSCTANLLPKVHQPAYQTYDNSGERGYKVSFSLSHDSIPPTAVVINRIQQNISEENKVGLTYHINVLTQSRKIFGFKPNVTERENGIFFKTDTAEVFKPVNFRLKAE